MIFGLQAYLVLAAFLFSLGVYCVMTRRNAISILMGLELILNSANINYVAFSRFAVFDGAANLFSGQIFAVFVIMLAAAEAVIALAIIVSIYRSLGNIKVDEANILKS